MTRPKTIFDPKYKSLINEIVKLRKSKNLSQRALADIMGESHAFIGTIETRSRRMDFLETVRILKAIGLSKSEISKFLEKFI